jgi:hypothetical protein
MSSEIIQNVAYDNFDNFQHVNAIFSQYFISLFEDNLVTKLIPPNFDNFGTFFPQKSFIWVALDFCFLVCKW